MLIKKLLTLLSSILFITSTSLYSENWAQETLTLMTVEEKIGQLIMFGFFPQKQDSQAVEEIIREYHIGGIMFMKGNTQDQIKLTNHFQSLSNYPLLIGQDNEWGLNMRLSDAERFPRNMTLGAIQNNSLIYHLGREIGKQCRMIGVHINFSPVVDINSNPSNPVINDRSFGEDKEDVTTKAMLMMQGLQEENIIACAKHWPGHGDTANDSHLTLPVITKNWLDLRQCEIYPFQQLINAGLRSVMTAHLYFPEFDHSSVYPASLSQELIQEKLINELQFKGLVISDALMGMNAITDHYRPGEAEIQALLAGTDILLYPADVSKTVEYIKTALNDNILSIEELDAHVLKILEAKEWVHLDENRFTPTSPVLHTQQAKKLKKELYENAVTLLKNDEQLLPLQAVKKQKIAFVQLGKDILYSQAIEALRNNEVIDDTAEDLPPFFTSLTDHIAVDYFFISRKQTDQIDAILNDLQEYDVIIVGLYEMNKFMEKQFGVSTSTFDFIEKLKDLNAKVILTLFGSPYSLMYFGHENAIVMAYENDPDAQIASAKILLGLMTACGKLPVSASAQFVKGSGL